LGDTDLFNYAEVEVQTGYHNDYLPYWIPGQDFLKTSRVEFTAAMHHSHTVICHQEGNDSLNPALNRGLNASPTEIQMQMPGS